MCFRPYSFAHMSLFFLVFPFSPRVVSSGGNAPAHYLALPGSRPSSVNYHQLALGFPSAIITTRGRRRTRNYIFRMFLSWIRFLLHFFYSPVTALLSCLPYLHKRQPPSAVGNFQGTERTSWSVILLTTVFFTFIDIVIDPVALRGDRWFLGQIYGYPDPGIYFGVPIANFLGWAFVGSVALTLYRFIDQRFWGESPPAKEIVKGDLLLGVGLYYGVLAFNLAITFWIGETLIGMVGCFLYFPVTVFLVLRICGQLPSLPSSTPTRH